MKEEGETDKEVCQFGLMLYHVTKCLKRNELLEDMRSKIKELGGDESLSVIDSLMMEADPHKP